VGLGGSEEKPAKRKPKKQLGIKASGKWKRKKAKKSGPEVLKEKEGVTLKQRGGFGTVVI